MLGVWNVIHQTRGNDTRVFSHKRSGIFEGYAALPAVDDRLSFTFPEGCRKSARVVTFEEGEDDMFGQALHLELWSPNSFKYPFFPGLSSAESRNPPLYPRIDSHRGRFDPSRNPQYFDVRQPHLSFIRRSDKGVMSSQEVECVPLYAVWESSSYPSRDKGYVQESYWSKILDRTKFLRRQVREIARKGSYYTFPGFQEAQPPTSSVERDPRLPGRMSFEEMVSLLSDIQFELKLMAAWVRMAEALDRLNWNSDSPYTMDSRSIRVEDSLVGLWVNGMTENMVSWFFQASVPLYVCHTVRGSQDWPDESPHSLLVNDGLDSCELRRSGVIEVWNSLYREAEKIEPSQWTLTTVEHANQQDKLESWRSSSKATKTNFPGESWGLLMEAPPKVEDDGLFPAPPEIAPLVPGYEPYIKPPPVQAANLKIRIRHYIEDFDDNFDRCFKYTSQEDIYSSFIYTYVDRPNRRYIHTDSRLYIEPGIVHPVEVFGLPGPRIKFYDDFECRIRTRSPYWVYEKEIPLAEDVGKAAPTPSFERLRPSDKPSQETIEEPRITSGVSSEDLDVASKQRPLDLPSPEHISNVEEEGDDHNEEPSIVEDVRLENIPPPPRKSSMIDSVIPGEDRVCIWDVSPFVMVTGIGQVEIVEFREWLQSKAPSLKLIAVARALERKYAHGNLVRKRKVLYLKFWDRSHAASFWYAFQDAELMEKDMRIHGLTMKEFKALKKRDLLDYWDIELAGKLNPLINRIKEPLVNCLSDHPYEGKRPQSLVDRLSDFPHEGKRPRLESEDSIREEPRRDTLKNAEGGRIMSKVRRGGRAWKWMKTRMGEMK
ncbi:hypothetical protein C8R42DRAFT_730030 [Lentinula raphanica]|nr:hypothetical protein C8R42DRAFT_730030 [Lentinula raphanica]